MNKSVQENYGDFIAPALLAEWQKDFKSPGKAAFKSVAGTYRDFKRERASRVRYLVKGEIIEMTSGNGKRK